MSQKVIGIESGFSGDIVEIPFLGKENVRAGDEIIFRDEDEAEEYGVVKFVDRETAARDKILFSSRILRKITPNDIQKIERSIEQAKQAIHSCRELVIKHNLNIQIFQAGFSFDEKKAKFLFSSDDRVDFRDLVRDLAKDIKKQIYLRQIGPRDKARMVDGFGKCGRPFCCSTFLGSLESVTMEMARIQALEGKGSSKLSGACGKLLCCLKYEVEAYKQLRQRLPEIGSIVNKGRVIGLDILNQKVKIYSKDDQYLVVEASDIS